MDDEQRVTVPAFELDCRDWLLSRPQDEAIADSEPVLAVMSTAVIGDDDLSTGTAVLSVGVLDHDDVVRFDVESRGGVELLELDDAHGYVSYLVPTPDGRLALLAELQVPDGTAHPDEVFDRFHHLMESFSWAA